MSDNSDEKISDVEFARLRATLEQRQERFIGMIGALSRADETSPVGDALFRFLGITTFWLSLPRPSRRAYEQVKRALAQVTIEKVPIGRVPR